MGGQSPGREEQRKANVLGLRPEGSGALGARAKGPEEALGGKCALCVLGSCAPSLPWRNDRQGRNDSLQL